MVSPKLIKQWQKIFHLVEDMHLTKAMDAALLEKLRNFKFHKDDVLISCVPRSGRRWTAEMTWLVINNADVERAESIEMYDRAIWIEEKDLFSDRPDALERLEQMAPPRVILSHFLPQFYEAQRKEVGFKTVIVTRNFKDNLASRYRMMYDIFEWKVSFNEFFELFRNGYELFTGWANHYIKSMELQDHPGVLWLRYEDIITDPEAVLRKLSDLCGKTLNAEQIKSIVEFTQFSTMKERHSKSDLVMQHPKATSLIRKGIVGDWENYFTTEQEEFVKTYLKEATEKASSLKAKDTLSTD